MTEPTTDLPEADALDQRTEVSDVDAENTPTTAPPLEADPADVAEQQAVVDLTDEED
ncbi:hypothetical protein [Amycolatopsis sp. CA-230715]|uniref:hypothetical protein n=1 Tax=Amycolatopsis sp. CA-230715 TaxID=2745196 RepID=UPI001C015A10|nr:hypothetical protein [Amycolatopsis sp. CA-230715]QWF84578.1 hypothetical protein HUW46_08029 [Amycolatopsis sp. CA-230715]